MRKLVAVAALIVAFAVPTAASAQIFIGARLGYGFPWGDIMTSWSLDESLKSQIPVTLDLGIKFGQALAVGAYAAYGFGQQSSDWKNDCDDLNVDCSVADLRVGAQLNLHAANTETTEFWGGVALGYEQLMFKDDSLSDDVTFKGYDATLQGGFDFRASPSFRVGPFASLTVGQFTKVESATEVDIDDKEFHGYFQIGVRGMWGN